MMLAVENTSRARVEGGVSLTITKHSDAEVFPLRIERSNEVVLLFAAPAFNFLFARDRSSDIPVRFIVHDPIDLVSLGKASVRSVAVIPEPTLNAVC